MKITKFMKNNMIISITVAILVCVVLLWAVVRQFGYSTPTPASNEQEKAYFEQRAKEWEKEQQRLKDIR